MCRLITWIKLRNSEKVCKQVFSKKEIYLMCRTENLVVRSWKGKKTPRVKHEVLFVGRQKSIKYAIAFSLLFIYCLLSYFGYKPEIQDLFDFNLGLNSNWILDLISDLFVSIQTFDPNLLIHNITFWPLWSPWHDRLRLPRSHLAYLISYIRYPYYHH